MKKITTVITLLGCLFPLASHAQLGCTDPQAINYDAQATENDGSCIYPTTNLAPTILAELSPSLTECSGLAYFDDILWTQLDGGNPDQIHELDTLNGTIANTITISNADNKDWEDLAEDEEHLYIGDFGNNFGNRTDLRIYKIKKSNLLGGTPSPELIEFSFSDQTDFTPNQNAHNYDCEAFFFYQDSLHLFSKNWADFKSRHYVLPTSAGVHVAMLRDSLEAQGQITAADISDNGAVLLLGYNTSTIETYLWLLFDYPGNSFFSGNKRKISLGSAILNSQVEGIAFKDSTSGFICSEQLSSFVKAKLLSFDIGQYLSDPVAVGWQEEAGNLHAFPNPVTDQLHVEIPANTALLQVVDLLGKPVFEKRLDKKDRTGSISIDLSHVVAGHYFLVLQNEKQSYQKAFVKQ